MFKTLTADIPRDRDYPPRQHTIRLNQLVLDGQLYDHLPFAFHDEKDQNKQYIELRRRRPSVRYALARVVVDDSVALLFSEGHFPAVECSEREVVASLKALIKECTLNQVMIDGATRGSVGSVVFMLRILVGDDYKYRAFFDVLSTEFLTPVFNRKNPRRLKLVRERYKVSAQDLRAQGYTQIREDRRDEWWFMREWDPQWERRYKPWPVKPGELEKGMVPLIIEDEPTLTHIDVDRSTEHRLGFVPLVWTKNLPGPLPLHDGGRSDVDGDCTFRLALDTGIEIDYLLSQGGRGLKYTMDPTLMIKEPPADADGKMVKSPANAIVVDKDGDAKLLEISGAATTAVIGYVRAARQLALESVHGNRSDPDKLNAVQSGRAMELMHAALIALADKLRISYGERALLELLRMTLKAHAKYPLTVMEKAWPKMNPKAKLALRWPAWFPSTATDRQQDATALAMHTKARHMSAETATKVIAGEYDLEDPRAERTTIEGEQARRAARPQPS
jgi:hypothetical protein